MKKKIFDKEPTQFRFPRKLDAEGFPKYGPKGEIICDVSDILALADALRSSKERK